jgi:hypothetical protein
MNQLAKEDRKMTMTCIERVNEGSWCQETYETATRDAGRRARQLRQAGYQASVVRLGYQITAVGRVALSLVNIRPGEHNNTFGLPEVKNA